MRIEGVHCIRLDNFRILHIQLAAHIHSLELLILAMADQHQQSTNEKEEEEGEERTKKG